MSTTHAVARDPALLTAITAHTGIQFNALLEPFLPIAHPTLNLVLTSYRTSDVDAQVRCLNDPAVALNLSGPPFPNRREDSLGWQAVVNGRFEAQLARWAAGDWTPPNDHVFGLIRDVDSGELVGDLGYTRWAWEDLAHDSEARAEAVAREKAIVAGNPEATWSFGFWLNPDFQGKGVMAAAVSSLVHNYMIPILHCEHIRSCAFVGNWPSRKVHERFGFECTGTFVATPNAAMRGREKEQWAFVWRKPEGELQ